MAARAGRGSLEAEVLQHLWETGEATVEEVHKALSAKRRIAYTTVMTVMARLAKKGMLHRRKEGRAYVYEAAVDRTDFARSSLKQWTERFFGGKVVPAVAFMLGQARLSPGELAEIRRLVDRLSEENEKEDRKEERL